EGLKGWTITGMKENSASGFKIEGAPHGLTVTGPGGGSVSQTIAYVPGDYYAVVECRSPSGLPHGKATLGLVALNPAGGSERGPDGRRYYLPNAPVVFRPGESNVLALSFRLPPGEGKVVQVKLSITFADLGADDKILLDHLDIYRENTP
ncbi:MAG: hypothetical protein JWM35_699, partial [Verrucomicrobia bacterium]|nr:hypothetical protein [Verrucomicrobiota bacterium]